MTNIVMKSKPFHIVFLFIFLLLFTTPLMSQTNTNISNTLLYEGEQHVSVNPANKNNIIITYMANRSSGKMDIAVCYSLNGGISFSSPYYIDHISTNFTSADPSVAFFEDGTAYLCYVDYLRYSSDSGFVIIRKSTNGGANFGDPKIVRDVRETSDLAIDRPWLAVDNMNQSEKGFLYVTSMPAKWASAVGQNLHLKYSTNGGESWSNDIIVSGQGFPGFHGSMGSVVKCSNKTLLIAYYSLDGLNPCLALAKSTNNGLSFQRNKIVDVNSIGDTLLQMSYCLVSNPLNNNILGLSYVYKNGSETDIFNTISTNSGLNWNNPVRVNNDSTGNLKFQDMCWGFWDISGYGIGWRDRRNFVGGSQSPYDIYYAISSDNGVSFSNYKINLTPIIWNQYGQTGNDFLGFAIANNKVHMSWNKSMSGFNWDIFYGTNISTSIPGNIESAKSIEYVKCFPNPFNMSFKLEILLNKSSMLSLKIYNVKGELIYSEVKSTVANSVLNIQKTLSNLNSGVYYCIVRDLLSNDSHSFPIVCIK